MLQKPQKQVLRHASTVGAWVVPTTSYFHHLAEVVSAVEWNVCQCCAGLWGALQCVEWRSEQIEREKRQYHKVDTLNHLCEALVSLQTPHQQGPQVIVFLTALKKRGGQQRETRWMQSHRQCVGTDLAKHVVTRFTLCEENTISQVHVPLQHHHQISSSSSSHLKQSIQGMFLTCNSILQSPTRGQGASEAQMPGLIG